MTRKGRSSESAALSEVAWTLRIPRHAVLLTEIQTVHHRLSRLAALYTDREGEADNETALLVPYTEAVVSPMFVTLQADEVLSTRALGPRQNYLPLPRGVSEEEARPLLKQMVKALMELHSRRVVHGHCDVDSFLREKAPRQRVVLVDHPIPVSILAMQSEHGKRARRCAAPEICCNAPFTPAADVWSVGVLLLRLTLPAEKEFTTEDVVDTNILSPFLLLLSGAARSLLVLCLKEEPSGRPTLWELLEHPFFKGEEKQEEEEEHALTSDRDSGESSRSAESSSSSSEDDEEDADEECDDD